MIVQYTSVWTCYGWDTKTSYDTRIPKLITNPGIGEYTSSGKKIITGGIIIAGFGFPVFHSFLLDACSVIIIIDCFLIIII